MRSFVTSKYKLIVNYRHHINFTENTDETDMLLQAV